MIVILWAFTLFHVAVGLASLGLALRLLTPTERAHWNSPAALLVGTVEADVGVENGVVTSISEIVSLAETPCDFRIGNAVE